jgi:hypothetical protein
MAAGGRAGEGPSVPVWHSKSSQIRRFRRFDPWNKAPPITRDKRGLSGVMAWQGADAMSAN